MDNIIKLQTQYVRFIRIALIFADILVVLLAFLLASMNALKEMSILGGVFIVLLGFHLLLLKARTTDASLKSLPPAVLNAINEECMTGFRCGDAILCESGCLLIVNVNVRAFPLRNIKRLSIQRIGRGRFIYITNMQEQTCRINFPGSGTTLGNGTFRELEVEFFWKKLNDMWEKYADTDPKQESAEQNYR